MEVPRSKSHVDKKREKHGIIDVKFAKVDLAVYSTFKEWPKLEQTKYCLSVALVLKYFVDYLSDAGVAAGALQHEDKRDAGIAYLVFVGLSWLLLVKEIVDAWRIVRSDDVSDAFTNAEAFRYYSIRSPRHWKLFQEINRSKNKKDKVLALAYFTFKNWKRLLFVAFPQTILTFAIVLPTQGSGQALSGTTTVSLIFKLVLLGVSMLKLIVVLVMYPFLKCWTKGPIREFYSYRIDKRLTELVRETYDGGKHKVSGPSEANGDDAITTAV